VQQLPPCKAAAQALRMVHTGSSTGPADGAHWQQQVASWQAQLCTETTGPPACSTIQGNNITGGLPVQWSTLIKLKEL
jgi:hypothetical protein